MILVTGGTGMLGAHLLLNLVQNNLSIRATYRTKSRLEETRSFFKNTTADKKNYFDRIQWVKTSLEDLYTLNQVFEGVELVYHCAAKVSFAAFNKEKLYQSNAEGTASVVNLCLKHGVKKLAYVSSIASIGADQSLAIVNETHNWSSSQHHTYYAQSKYKAELEVWRGAQEGLDVVIVNPGLILGSHFWDRSSGTLYKMIHRGLRFHPIGNTALVALEDVVEVLIQLMESTIKNQRFILVAENRTQKKFLESIASNLNKKKPSFPLHYGLLVFLFVLDKSLALLGFKKGFLSLGLIHMLCSRQEYDGSKITRALPFQYKSIEDTIQKTAFAF